MAQRRSKPGPARWLDLTAALRSDVLNAIDSAKGESAKSIYDRFGLAQRDLNWHTFRRMVGVRRKKVDPVAEDLSADVPGWEELDRMMRGAIAANVRSGNVKVYEAATVIRSCHDRQRLKIEQAADRRAQERFDAWKGDYEQEKARRIAAAKPKLRDAGLTDETIALIDQVYGLGGGDGG